MFNDAYQQALGFLISQVSYIEPQVYEIQYPDIQYPEIIPVDTSASAWAKSVTFFSNNKVGRAGWFSARGTDMHFADAERAKFEVGIEMADIGYEYDLEELGQAMLIPGMNLSADRAMAARRAFEEFVDGVVISGDASKNFDGILNYPGITVVDAPNNAGATSTYFSAKTEDEVLTDFNTILTGVFTSTLTVEMADTVLVPYGVLTSLATRRLPNTDVALLQFLMQNNAYTFMTGKPLTIRGLRGLGNGATDNSGRMVAYRRDPQVVKFHMPMPHRFLPPMQTGPLVFAVPGIFRIGGLEVRRPGAFRYMDKIEATATI